jgi:peptidoglycan/xylan/chitin deacetylase (PgdA/CDA1 family)
MEVIKHYKDMGHEIASHTYQHKELAGLSAAEIEYQMNTQSDIIKKAAGVRPAIARPPAGSFDDNALAVLRNLGYAVVDWDVDTNDWKTHNFADETAAYKTMDKDTSSTVGHITLEHEVYDQTVNQLVPWAIEYIKSKGYKFVTMSECLGVPAYYN